MAATQAGRRAVPDFGAEAFSTFGNSAAALALTAAISALAAASAWLIGGAALAIACSSLAIVYVIAISLLPPGIVMPVYRARALLAGQGDRISGLAHEIGSVRAGLPSAPQIYVLPSLMVTSFALGTRARSAIALSEGLLREMTLREIAGIIAHETAHISCGDAQLFALSDAVARIAQALGLLGAALGLGNILGAILDEPIVPWSAVIVLYVTPALIGLVQMTLPHRREFAADLAAARLTGDALGLAAAIRRLTPAAGTVHEELTPPAFARKLPLPSLLRAHPDSGRRVERVLASVRDTGTAFAPIATSEEPMVLHVGFGPAQMRRRYRWPGVWW